MSLIILVVCCMRVRNLYPCMRLRSHYAQRIWKRSLISMLRPNFLTNRFENGAFWKRFSNRRNLKSPAFVAFSCGRKTFWKLTFRNVHITIMTWFPWPSFPKTKIKNDNCCVFRVKLPFSNFLGVVATGLSISILDLLVCKQVFC